MSKALVVGGDKVDGIRQVLFSRGIDQVDHWSGRKAGDMRRDIPRNLELIVLVTNSINHSFTYRIKNLANKRGLKVVFTKNGADSLQRALVSASEPRDGCRETIYNFDTKFKPRCCKDITHRYYAPKTPYPASLHRSPDFFNFYVPSRKA